MNAADIHKETLHVVGPNGEPVVLVPIKQKKESDIAPSISGYTACVAFALIIASLFGLLAFVFLMVAVFSEDSIFYTLTLSMFGVMVTFILLAVPCCVKLNRHQNMRVQQFMYRDGLDNLMA